MIPKFTKSKAGINTAQLDILSKISTYKDAVGNPAWVSIWDLSINMKIASGGCGKSCQRLESLGYLTRKDVGKGTMVYITAKGLDTVKQLTIS